MKTIILKTVLLGLFATSALGAIAKEKEVLNKTGAIIKTAEEQLIDEVLQNEMEADQFLDSFDSETSIFIYDTKGDLILEAKLKEPMLRKTKKLIYQSSLLAVIDGSQYYLLSE